MTIAGLFKKRIFTVSNILSFSRIFAAPAVIFLFYLENMHKGDLLLKIFIIAVISYIILSDFFDGFLARYLKQETVLGSFLDPVADKIALILVGTALCYYRDFPVWFLAFMILRDIVTMSFGWFLFSKRNLAVKPSLLGKLCTALTAIAGFMYVAEINLMLTGIRFKSALLVLIAVLWVINSGWYAFVWIAAGKRHKKTVRHLRV